MLLSKTDFKKYLTCPFYLWLFKYRKDLLPEELIHPSGKFIDEGKEVDELSKGLFPKGVEIGEFNLEGWKRTQASIKKGSKILIQPTVVAGELTSRADFLIYNEDFERWDIYEVKSSTAVKRGGQKTWNENQIVDVAFQKITWEKAGIKIGATYIVYVNKDFVKHGEVKAEFCGPEKGEKGFFVKENVSGEVSEMMPFIEPEIESALSVIRIQKDVHEAMNALCPDINSCNFISELSSDVRKMLGVELITEEGEEKKNLESVRLALKSLSYPLYFFDYETYDSAIPLFDGFHPYQKMPFQYSLHIKKSSSSKVEHKYFLADKLENPMPDLLAQLNKDIGPRGSILVWYESFEKTRNEEMAKMYPEYADFLRGVNERVFDLMKVFDKELYWRKEFGTSRSLKVVAPVLAPDLPYSELNIHEGGTASASWKELVDSNLPEHKKQELKTDMLKYCQRDTEVMVRILDVVEREIKDGKN
ncbi:MAG: DUF2779 domain-containing protein [Patescibacteria group bacterium]|nr:DUF2779 domain-containing protein [Patescibacteria group bacterium]